MFNYFNAMSFKFFADKSTFKKNCSLLSRKWPKITCFYKTILVNDNHRNYVKGDYQKYAK